MYVTIPGRRAPTPGSAAELVQKHGIEALRGIALVDGARTLYVHDGLIDKMLAEAAEDPEVAANQWRERCYGGDTPDAPLVEWIYLNTVQPAVEPVAA